MNARNRDEYQALPGHFGPLSAPTRLLKAAIFRSHFPARHARQIPEGGRAARRTVRIRRGESGRQLRSEEYRPQVRSRLCVYKNLRFQQRTDQVSLLITQNVDDFPPGAAPNSLRFKLPLEAVATAAGFPSLEGAHANEATAMLPSPSEGVSCELLSRGLRCIA
jgi:hypothetical protein